MSLEYILDIIINNLCLTDEPVWIIKARMWYELCIQLGYNAKPMTLNYIVGHMILRGFNIFEEVYYYKEDPNEDEIHYIFLKNYN